MGRPVHERHRDLLPVLIAQRVVVIDRALLPRHPEIVGHPRHHRSCVVAQVAPGAGDERDPGGGHGSSVPDTDAGVTRGRLIVEGA